MAISLELHNFFLSLSFFLPRHEPKRTEIRTLTSLCCASIALVIPADLGDHWGLIVHHIQVWSRVLTSQFKVGRLFADSVLHEVTNMYGEGSEWRGGGKNPKRSPHHNTHGTRSPTTRPFHVGGGVRRSEARKSSRLESCAEEMAKVLIQYGAQLRSAISRYKHGGFKASHST